VHKIKKRQINRHFQSPMLIEFQPSRHTHRSSSNQSRQPMVSNALSCQSTTATQHASRNIHGNSLHQDCTKLHLRQTIMQLRVVDIDVRLFSKHISAKAPNCIIAIVHGKNYIKCFSDDKCVSSSSIPALFFVTLRPW
jgi:hypothetical protein